MLIADLIIELTASATGISVRQIKSEVKDKDYADARKIAVALMVEHKCTNSAIARALKYKDRSSVTKAHDQHKIMIQDEAANYNYVVTFKRAQFCTRKAVDMLMNNMELNLEQVLDSILKRC